MGRKAEINELARRERQIMDVILRKGECSVSDVRAELADPPSYSAVRTMIRHLEAKKLLKHREEGRRYLYQPTQSRDSASRSALKRLLDVFFDGSASDAVAAILDVTADDISPADLKRMSDLIRQARSQGK
ncbi:MAG: BlaI/MecI/CopY family transcriptional regulator [Planctomycetaceae bacterium]